MKLIPCAWPQTHVVRLAFLAMLSWLLNHHGSSADEPVRIALRPVVNAASREKVTLAQVAELSGGRHHVRSVIAKLDLAISPDQPQSVLTRREAQTRLLLAGFQPDEFQLTGSSDVTIHTGAAASWRRQAAGSIAQRVSESLNIDPTEVVVQITTPLDQDQRLKGYGVDQVELAPLDHGDRLIGQKSVELGVFSGSRMLDQIPVIARISILRDVVISRRPIERGEIIDKSNTYIERRELSTPRLESYLSPDQLGQASRRRLRAQHVLRTVDVVNGGGTSSAEVLVRPRDLVTVIVEQDGLRISMSGMEVMRAGRAGELVPVRNPTSKKTLYGRVQRSGVIELVMQ